MKNVPINEAESIFEAFWDSGESYPTHHKFNVLSEYQVSVYPGAAARAEPMWCGVNVTIIASKAGAKAVTLERDCKIDIADYDIFRIFASIPATLRIKIECIVDGRPQTVIDAPGKDDTCEIDGRIHGREMTHLRIDFYNMQAKTATATLLWLGLSNSDRQQRLENAKSPYTPDWPGCFERNPVIKPTSGIFFDEKELEQLREKIQKEPFKSIYEGIRIQAEKDMSNEPEKEIGTFIATGDRRWQRDRDFKRSNLIEPMERLAFVGIVSSNMDMLRMACRMALSAAHHTYWCDSIMGVFPGATWHHRSFTEDVVCHACALVLDWAGSLLTWHGRNILYDALIMKGLPRIEADFKTMEYIRHMNQGIVFSAGRITALLALSRVYPRYTLWLDSAEKDVIEMLQDYILPDGGTKEGPAYWNYTISQILPVLCILARRRGIPLEKYVPDCVLKTGDYALCMLSQAKDGTMTLPVNDAHSQRYSPVVSACYSRLSPRREWNWLYARYLDDMKDKADIVTLLLCSEPKGIDTGMNPLQEGLTLLPDVGQASYIAKDTTLGRIQFHLCSGPTDFGHFHEDKGSFILEAAGEALAIDRGMCTYSSPHGAMMSKTGSHNLFTPLQTDGQPFAQPRFNQGGKITFGKLKDGILMLTCDNLEAWQDGVFSRNYRRVFSPLPRVYYIHDDVAYLQKTASSFRVNTHGKISAQDDGWLIHGEHACLKVTPLDWVPEKAAYGEYGFDENIKPVNQLCLTTHEGLLHSVVTRIEILPCDAEPSGLQDEAIDPAIKIQNGSGELSVSINGTVFAAQGDKWTTQ